MSFQFEELPNDMKMLAMLDGELSNSATFFSTFAKVEMTVLTGSSLHVNGNPGSMQID